MAKFTMNGKTFDAENPYIKNRKEIAQLAEKHGIVDALCACDLYKQEMGADIPPEAKEEYLAFYQAMHDGDYTQNVQELEAQGV